jgi:hypothetical protein
LTLNDGREEKSLMLIMKYFPKIGKHSPVKDIPVRNHNNDNQALNFFKDVKEPDPDV